MFSKLWLVPSSNNLGTSSEDSGCDHLARKTELVSQIGTVDGMMGGEGVCMNKSSVYSGLGLGRLPLVVTKWLWKDSQR